MPSELFLFHKECNYVLQSILGKRREKISIFFETSRAVGLLSKNLKQSLSTVNSSFVVVVPVFLLIEVNLKKERKRG